MDVLQAIHGRRSIRRFRAEPVPDDVVRQVVDAGRWAPSASNRQPWKFIVIQDAAIRKELASVTTYGRFLSEAPVAIAVVIDPSGSTHPVEDGAAATLNMLLAAHGLGLGGCWIGSYGSVYEDRARRLLGIPADRRLLAIIAVGFPAEAGSSSRKPLGQLMCTDRYTD